MKLLKMQYNFCWQFIINGSIENKDIVSSVDKFMISEKAKNNVTDVIKTQKNLLYQDQKNKKVT